MRLKNEEALGDDAGTDVEATSNNKKKQKKKGGRQSSISNWFKKPA